MVWLTGKALAWLAFSEALAVEQDGAGLVASFRCNSRDIVDLINAFTLSLLP